MKTLIGFVTGALTGTIVGGFGAIAMLMWAADSENAVWIIDGDGHEFIKKNKSNFNDHVVEQ